MISSVLDIVFNPTAGLCVALAAGLLKEVLDCFFVFDFSKPFVRYKGFSIVRFSFTDLFFDAAGALAVFLVFLFLEV